MNSNKVLELQDICYGDILTNVSLNWRQGEILALMGDNGAGKSTLARLIAGLIVPSAGEILLRRGGVYSPWDKVKRWQEIGFVGQHPRRQTIGATVAEELGFGLINLGLDQREVRERVRHLAEEIGLQGKENQSPATLSGGERQRLVTAAILALQPSFLILDEGLSMLDARAQTKVLELLVQARPKTGQLWITHDPELARQADRLLVLDKGKIVDWGNPSEAFNNHFHELSAFDVKFVGSLKTGIASIKEIDPLVQDRQGKGTQLDDRASGILEWAHADFNTRLRLNKVIRPGEFLGIVGPSGSGKTTLLESVAGFIFPSDGRLFLDGEVMDKNSVHALRRKSGFVLQEAGEYLIGRNVFHEIFYNDPRQNLKPLSEEQTLFMEQYALPAHMASCTPERLSGGERQRVALAAAMRTVPSILLLDEPLLGLDAKSKARIQATVFALKGITILYVTHDLREVLGAADRIWLVENGMVVLDCQAQSWQEHQEQFRRSGVRC